MDIRPRGSRGRIQIGRRDGSASNDLSVIGDEGAARRFYHLYYSVGQYGGRVAGAATTTQLLERGTQIRPRLHFLLYPAKRRDKFLWVSFTPIVPSGHFPHEWGKKDDFLPPQAGPTYKGGGERQRDGGVSSEGGAKRSLGVNLSSRTPIGAPGPEADMSDPGSSLRDDTSKQPSVRGVGAHAITSPAQISGACSF